MIFFSPIRSNTEALHWSISWKLNIHETSLKWAENHSSCCWWYTHQHRRSFLRDSLGTLIWLSDGIKRVVKKTTQRCYVCRGLKRPSSHTTAKTHRGMENESKRCRARLPEYSPSGLLGAWESFVWFIRKYFYDCM